jgi:CheY-like chemotaxis protein
MSNHAPRLPQVTGRGGPIYPPAWYLDLVQLRSRRAEEVRSTALRGMHSAWNANPLIADTESTEAARLLALALEIVRPFHLEGLPYGHQVHILGLDILEVREYLSETFAEISLQASAAILIIEDEAAVALDLARIVRQTGHRVCGTAGHIEQAVALAGRTRPVLVLADVQLKDGPEAGIAAVQEIRQAGETAAVYVTAYPERVRHAVSAPLIVSKPFMAHEIQTAMWRALFRHGYATSAAA